MGRDNVESWGRRKRSTQFESDDEMTLSREILVLDFGDEASKAQSDPFSSNGKSLATRFVRRDHELAVASEAWHNH